ncbi:hypothetical protein KR054_010016 [Drosophila jambulina]|nr:hypothetical protein KR054_010016 [Drosophila jambulina]
MFKLKVFLFLCTFIAVHLQGCTPADNVNVNNVRLREMLQACGNKYTEQIIPPKFEKIGERYFYIDMQKRVNWFGAINSCRQMDGQLAVLQNKAELTAILNRLKGQDHFWLGISDLATSKEYVSILTGKMAPFFQWDVRQPEKKNYLGQIENCVCLYNQSMHDYPCDTNMRFICEV